MEFSESQEGIGPNVDPSSVEGMPPVPEDATEGTVFPEQTQKATKELPEFFVSEEEFQNWQKGIEVTLDSALNQQETGEFEVNAPTTKIKLLEEAMEKTSGGIEVPLGDKEDGPLELDNPYQEDHPEYLFDARKTFVPHPRKTTYKQDPNINNPITEEIKIDPETRLTTSEDGQRVLEQIKDRPEDKYGMIDKSDISEGESEEEPGVEIPGMTPVPEDAEPEAEETEYEMVQNEQNPGVREFVPKKQETSTPKKSLGERIAEKAGDAFDASFEKIGEAQYYAESGRNPNEFNQPEESDEELESIQEADPNLRDLANEPETKLTRRERKESMSKFRSRQEISLPRDNIIVRTVDMVSQKIAALRSNAESTGLDPEQLAQDPQALENQGMRRGAEHLSRGIQATVERGKELGRGLGRKLEFLSELKNSIAEIVDLEMQGRAQSQETQVVRQPESATPEESKAQLDQKTQAIIDGFKAELDKAAK